MNHNAFERSIQQQISLNKTRTPTERLNALCDLLDSVRALAPSGPEARERRIRALAVRERDRGEFRATCKRLAARESEVSIRLAESLIVTKLTSMRPQDEADIQDLLAAHGGRLDLDFICSELETFSAPDDARRTKFETWVRQTGSEG